MEPRKRGPKCLEHKDPRKKYCYRLPIATGKAIQLEAERFDKSQSDVIVDRMKGEPPPL